MHIFFNSSDSFGDKAPTTDDAKIFTCFYIVVGVSILCAGGIIASDFWNQALSGKDKLSSNKAIKKMIDAGDKRLSDVSVASSERDSVDSDGLRQLSAEVESKNKPFFSNVSIDVAPPPITNKDTLYRLKNMQMLLFSDELKVRIILLLLFSLLVDDFILPMYMIFV